MRGGLILFTVLFSAVSGYRPTNFLYNEQKLPTLSGTNSHDDDGAAFINKETTLEPLDSSTLNTVASSSSAKPIQTTTLHVKPEDELEEAHEESMEIIGGNETPALNPSAPPEKPQELLVTTEPAEPHEENKRRQVTYDQRQEGQFNLRADLENFMFVFVPSSAASGMNLLDLLAKSNSRRSSTKLKRKQFHSSPLAISKPLGAGRYQQDVKNVNPNYSNYWNRHAEGVLLSSPVDGAHASPLGLGSRAGEFIEGRTPYHVDISANDEEHSRLHTEQVEVLPPPVYPFTHLIKPYYHLEAEPTVIQALPPPLSEPAGPTPYITTYSSTAAKGNIGQSALTALSGENSGRSAKIDVQSNTNTNNNNNGYYRLARAIFHNDFVDTNRVTNAAASGVYGARRTNVPIYRTEYSAGASNIYPPIDVPRYETVNIDARSVALDPSDDEIQNLAHDHHIGEIIVPSVGEDDIDLSGTIFIDAEAKALLSDGMARCAPGRRRDSYGVCREIEGY